MVVPLYLKDMSVLSSCDLFEYVQVQPPLNEYLALDFIADCEISNNFIIFSDSLSVLKSLDHTSAKIHKFKNYLKNNMIYPYIMK